MAEFRYKIRTSEGELREGTTQASSLASAVQGLQEQNLIVIDVAPAEKFFTLANVTGFSFERISERDIVILSRQLATLFDAQVPIIQSLETLADETGKDTLRKKLKDLIESIQGGMSMSQAMERHPDIFSQFYINMVRSGEEAGKLGDVFQYLADYVERSYELHTKVRNALIYPAFVLIAFVGVMVLLLTVIIPNIASIFEETGVALPIYTRIVIAISHFFARYWFWIAVALTALMTLGVWYKRTPSGKKAWSQLTISIPLIGGLLKKMYLARMTGSLQTLLSAGVPVIKSLQITARIVENEVYREILFRTVEEVRGGATIAEAFGNYDDVPKLVTQMIRVGEETGKLDKMLQSVAHFYRSEVNNLVDNFVSLIEPFLIIVLGAGVGFLVAAVLLPLYTISLSF